MKLANHHQVNGKKIIIHQPYYLAYPGFFHKLSLGDIFVIMDDAQYDKRFTNRNRIIKNNDWMCITVPINKKHKFENLKDFFKLVYQVLLGQEQGPRLGSFIKLYGVKETIDSIKKVLAK